MSKIQIYITSNNRLVDFINYSNKRDLTEQKNQEPLQTHLFL